MAFANALLLLRAPESSVIIIVKASSFDGVRALFLSLHPLKRLSRFFQTRLFPLHDSGVSSQ